ncbi:MAG: hypothetical protein HYY07_01050, partial [Elusimicrobia bacterium]|nr:hypothetical protein [Elusimicrobiota bacterium]
MNSFLHRFFRSFLIGLLLGNLTIPVSPNLLNAQSLLKAEEKSLEKNPQQTSEIEKSIERARFLRYSQERWNEMRRKLEKGETLILEEEKVPEAAVKKPLPPPPPMGPGINVVLPYESGLSISGRKVINFKLSSTIYSQPDLGKGRVSKSDFQLEQQLQVRVKGTVGRKVTVNVDFDDTREDKRNISVIYKGDPDEILQEAAFGDISISLPSTEFVQYSKSVFGARAELLFRPRTGFSRLLPSQLWPRYLPKQIKTYLIGSRTKGISQTKRFTGNTEPERVENLKDIDYLRRQFYQLAFSTGPKPLTEDRPIKIGSEKILLDDQDPNNYNVNETTRTFFILDQTVAALDGVSPATTTFQGPISTNTGVFAQLVPGIDYTIDYVKGTIRFIRTIKTKDVIVVDYTTEGSNTPLSQRTNEKDPLIK